MKPGVLWLLLCVSWITSAQDPQSCQCVPYYLCDDGIIKTDGSTIIDVRFGEPCESYLLVCCQLPNIVKTPMENATKCGAGAVAGVVTKVANQEGDNQARFAEFPWMLAILTEQHSKQLYQCGGSLIHPGVALTAAHCIKPETIFIVRAGEWDTQSNTERLPHQERNVKKVIVHPEYHNVTLRADIALIILDRPFDIAENVNTICLPKQDHVVRAGTKCVATGWGKDAFGSRGSFQATLKKVELPIVPHGECQRRMRTSRLGRSFNLHPSFICAGGEHGKDTCKGDGGSPLICPISDSPGRHFQAGIVSWGIGCGRNNTPGVYADVAEFSDWIDEQLEGYSSAFYTP